MTFDRTLPLHILMEPLRLLITLSDRLTDAQIDVWKKRLNAYVSAVGLKTTASPGGFLVVPGRRAAGPCDRGVVLDWLIEQREVAQVQVEPAGADGELLRLVFSTRV